MLPGTITTIMPPDTITNIMLPGIIITMPDTAIMAEAASPGPGAVGICAGRWAPIPAPPIIWRDPGLITGTTRAVHQSVRSWFGVTTSAGSSVRKTASGSCKAAMTAMPSEPERDRSQVPSPSGGPDGGAGTTALSARDQGSGQQCCRDEATESPFEAVYNDRMALGRMAQPQATRGQGVLAGGSFEPMVMG